MEPGPIDLRAGEPEPAQGLEQEPLVRLPVELVAQRGEDRAGTLHGHLLESQAAQRLARPHLEQHPSRLAPQLGDAAGEADGRDEMAHPVLRSHRLGGRDPGPRDVREPGDARRCQGDGAQQLPQRAGDGLHHRGVEGLVRLQAAAGEAFPGKPPLQPGDRLGGAGHHRHGRGVDRGEGEVGGEPRPRLLLRQRHGQQGSRRELTDQAGAPGHQHQGVGKLHHAGQAGRRVLPQAVTEEGRRPHPPTHPQPGEGIAHGEHRRLRDAGLPQERPRRRIPPSPPEQSAEVEARGSRFLRGLLGK